MSAAQLLIVVIGVTVSIITFVLMRYPQHRREQYRGRPFSIAASLVTAAIVLAACLVMVWAQGLYEARPVARARLLTTHAGLETVCVLPSNHAGASPFFLDRWTDGPVFVFFVVETS